MAHREQRIRFGGLVQLDVVIHATDVNIYSAVSVIRRLIDKTAELSQRRPRDAPNRWVP